MAFIKCPECGHEINEMKNVVQIADIQRQIYQEKKKKMATS